MLNPNGMASGTGRGARRHPKSRAPVLLCAGPNALVHHTT
jgi:hypothetical protein